MSLSDAIAMVQNYMLTLTGVRGAPANPPDAINAFPFIVCYSQSGTFAINTPEDKIAIHTLVVEVHVARKDLPRDIAAVMAFCESVPNLLFKKFRDDNKWNATIDGFDDQSELRYTFGGLGWGQAQGETANTIGFRFFVPVKIRSAIS